MFRMWGQMLMDVVDGFSRTVKPIQRDRLGIPLRDSSASRNALAEYRHVTMLLVLNGFRYLACCPFTSDQDQAKYTPPRSV